MNSEEETAQLLEKLMSGSKDESMQERMADAADDLYHRKSGS
jgi:hypothetical protein